MSISFVNRKQQSNTYQMKIFKRKFVWIFLWNAYFNYNQNCLLYWCYQNRLSDNGQKTVAVSYIEILSLQTYRTFAAPKYNTKGKKKIFSKIFATSIRVAAPDKCQFCLSAGTAPNIITKIRSKCSDRVMINKMDGTWNAQMICKCSIFWWNVNWYLSINHW